MLTMSPGASGRWKPSRPGSFFIFAKPAVTSRAPWSSMTRYASASPDVSAWTVGRHHGTLIRAVAPSPPWAARRRASIGNAPNVVPGDRNDRCGRDRLLCCVGTTPTQVGHPPDIHTGFSGQVPWQVAALYQRGGCRDCWCWRCVVRCCRLRGRGVTSGRGHRRCSGGCDPGSAPGVSSPWRSQSRSDCAGTPLSSAATEMPYTPRSGAASASR